MFHLMIWVLGIICIRSWEQINGYGPSPCFAEVESQQETEYIGRQRTLKMKMVNSHQTEEEKKDIHHKNLKNLKAIKSKTFKLLHINHTEQVSEVYLMYFYRSWWTVQWTV